MKKRVLKAGLLVLASSVLLACGGPSVPQYEGTEVQGVTADKILIGNTAASTGAFATVGTPFNVGLNAALKVYNDNGGFNGKKVELVHYDDEFNAEKGLTYTKKLVEEDQVFALVGHFGTPTVGATLDYISSESGIPMVYAATGISGLYNEDAEGYEKAIMSVQPIYNTEGRVLLARAVAATEGSYGLGGSKIGVISTTDEAGVGILDGIKRQAEEMDVEIKYVTTSADTGTNHSAAVNALKTDGCDVIIVAANQAPFQEIMRYMKDGGVDNVKVITSYVSANATELTTLATEGVITPTREVYTTAWLDITDATYFYAPEATNLVGQYLWTCYKALGVSLGAPNLYDFGVFGFSTEYWVAAEAIASYQLSLDAAEWFGSTAFAYSYNSYALAGYIAGTMFIEGLERVADANQELTWLNYINAMEKSPIDVPMGGGVDYANGQRLGIADLAVNKYDIATAQLVTYSGITTLEDVMANVK